MIEQDNAALIRVNTSLRLEILYLKQELIKQQEEIEL